MKISKELLTKLYIEENKKQKEIAIELNVKMYEVQNALVKHGIKRIGQPPQKHYAKWSNEETDYLKDNYGKENWKTIARKLKRTLSSVRNKIRKLELGDSRKATEYINAAELAEALGISKSTVSRWIKAKKLEAKLKTIAEKDKIYRIKVDKFWEFAKDNPKRMKWDLYNRNSLGKEPSWLGDEIKKYYKNKVKNGDKEWSKTELSYLEYYYNKGLTAKEIGEKIGRTKKSIESRIVILGIANKIINIPWKPIEIEMLTNMRNKNITLEKIADELGRSLGSVTVKWNRMKLNA